ncbi:MAG: uroporphyrinogen decarboxylase family protein [Armatimonadota bacterium]|nr:hypothetical protein [Armatimonadota bacterium]MCX7778090.1 hypothetical protein [Armatimonadota bacterium]MDW8025482.1 uroporphyrinogen decarboxylase family protein [Armatimonadota bacterium]
MTPRERLLMALQHKEADRVPFDLGSTSVTGIHRIAYQRLRDYLRLPKVEVKIFHTSQQLACVDDDVVKLLEVDVRGLRSNPPSKPPIEWWHDEEFSYYRDEWGIVRRMPLERGLYYDICESPLSNATSKSDVERYPFPDPVDDARFNGLKERAVKLRGEGYPVVLGGLCPGMLEMSLWLRGFENFYCDLRLNLKLAEALLDKILELKMRYWEKALSILEGLIDVVQEGDDYAGQHGLLINPDIWRKLFKPRLKELFSAIKRKADVFVFFHSCGSIYELIPDLIEVGVDALNPVQVAAANMDTRRLKSEFGDSIIFWGGGIDTQRILPMGTAEQVREEVKMRIEHLAEGGGFVFATVHNIQADVPPQNIIAMWEAMREFGVYG